MSPPTRNTGQEPAVPASQLLRTGDADPIQPSDGTENGSEACDKPPLREGVSAETVPPGPRVGATELPLTSPRGEGVPLRVAEGLDTTRTIPAGEPLNPDPVLRPPASPMLGGDSPLSSFTILPTEEGTVFPQCLITWILIVRYQVRIMRHFMKLK